MYTNLGVVDIFLKIFKKIWIEFQTQIFLNIFSRILEYFLKIKIQRKNVSSKKMKNILILKNYSALLS